MSDEWKVSERGEGREPGWERDLLERLAFAAVTEQRRARRWGIFFKLALLTYFVLLLGIAAWEGVEEAKLVDGKHTAVVKVEGVIAEGQQASAENLIEGLREAFEDKRTKGVILRINSPGGSPVQAAYVNAEIRRLRKEHPDTPLYAVVSDICASGGYYIAAAADKIYADRSSIVGSIGVRMDSFGFVEAIDKLGVERRLLTAGEHKGILDPFLPERPEEVAHVQGVLDEIHEQFIAVVKEGRGERLKGDEKALFSGLFWSGERGVELGLVDELAGPDYVAREVIGAEEMVDFTARKKWIDRFADRIGAATARTLLTLTGAEPSLR